MTGVPVILFFSTPIGFVFKYSILRGVGFSKFFRLKISSSLSCMSFVFKKQFSERSQILIRFRFSDPLNSHQFFSTSPVLKVHSLTLSTSMKLS